MQPDSLYIFLSAAFFLWIIRSLFFWLSIWQRYQKERLHRLRVLFQAAKIFLLSPLSLLTWLGIFLAFFLNLNDIPLNYPHYLVAVIVSILAIYTLWEIGTNRIQRPIFSFQSISIFILSFVSIIVFFSFPLTDNYTWLLLTSQMSVILLSLFIFFFTFPTEIYGDLQTRRALQKIPKKIKVFLLVGEGSASILLFLKQLVPQRSSLIVTDLTNQQNNLIKIIAESTSPSTKYLFIGQQEMTIQNMLQLDEMLHLSYVFLTPESSFLKQSQLTKLILALGTKRRQLIVPATIRHILKANNQQKMSVAFYQTGDEEQNTAFTLIPGKQKKDSLSFILKIGTDELSGTIPLIGRSQFVSLTPAVLLALAIGMTKEAIIRQLTTVVSQPGNGVYHKLRTGAVLIDASALDTQPLLFDLLHYLSVYPKERVVVLGLGTNFSQREMKEIASEIASVATVVFILGDHYQKILRKNLSVGSGKCKIATGGKKELQQFIADYNHHHAVLLFLGENTEEIVNSTLRSYPTIA